MKTKPNTNSSRMKNIFFLLLLFTGIVKAQIVNIPDANFKAALIADGIDTSGDGEIQTFEAFVVNQLHVDNANISNLIGLSSFVNVTALYCDNNAITFIDLSGNPNINYIKCSYNQLSFINLSNNPNLTDLLCDHNNLNGINLSNNPNLTDLWLFNNNLTTLDLSNCSSLRVLTCGNNVLASLNLSNNLSLTNLQCANNQLISLNISGLTNLTVLECSQNQLSVLNVSSAVNLQSFYCSDNQLTSLDVSGLSYIVSLHCSNNQLTSLDASGLSHLAGLDCSNNQLTELLIKNGRNEQLTINGNPNLQFICADESEIVYAQGQADLGVVVSSYCSFIPGGDYNTITGNIKYDFNNDGCDAGDTIFQNVRVNINDGTTTGASFINSSGNYIFFTQTGSFTITPAIENTAWFNFSPVTATIPFSNNNNNIANQDFCIAPNGVHQDLEVVLSPVIRARPGFDAVYKIVSKNKGTVALSNWTGLTLNYDDSKMSFVSSSQTPSNSSSGLLDFGYSLNPFESATIEVTFHINSPLDLNPVNIGTLLTFNATINPIATDESPADNAFVYAQTVVGSFDPNNIECLEGDVVPPTEIGNYLHYAINFENTGTFPAENIVVKTEVDATKFDINSLQLMNTSNPVDARITGNKVEFIFKNIDLGIGGHGHILLKIKTQNTLVTGDAVAKRADIFFDYNAPVDTGLATTVFQNLANTDFEMDTSVVISPNPTKGMLLIHAKENLKSIQIFDEQGRIIQANLVEGSESKMDVSNYSEGVYFIKVITTKGAKVEKILKK
jgi:hypothetical protein